MKNKRYFLLFATILLLIASIACDISFKDSGPSDEEISIQLTMQAIQQTQTAAAQPKPATGEDQASDSSQDEEGNNNASAPDDSEDDCNLSKFVSETIPDGTVYQPGDTFTKTWTIRNIGTCKWNTDYRFVFEEGNQMGGPSSIKLNHPVATGDTYTFKIDLTAPSSNGDYTGVWRIKSDDGENLGKYWVKITVGSPAPPPASFAVTSVGFYMPHTWIDMSCPGYVNVKAEITTSAAGKVTFKMDDSTGCPGCATKSLMFSSAGSQIIDHTLNATASGDYWVKLYIDEPNHQWFGPKNFHVNCTP